MVLRRIGGGWIKAGDRSRAVALALMAAAGLAACSSTPKYVNPVELYRSAAGFTLNDDTTGERNAQNLEAGRNQPYPNLGTVPPPPDRAMSSIDRQKLQQGLADDRAQAKQSDADLLASRGAAGSAGAPTSITRPSSATDGATAAEAKRNADPSLAGKRPDASSARRRSPSGSEPAPQETALNSPTAAHAMPEGDTPRPAPPPPSLPPPEKARKSAADRAAKPSPAPATAKRPSPAPQTAAADLPDPTASPSDAGPPRSPSPPDAAKAQTAPAGGSKPAAPPTAPADPAMRIPPPPPADMMMPAPDKTAAAEPAQPTPPPAVAAPADAPKAATTPDTAAPAAPWPPPLGPGDTEQSPPRQTAALDPAPPPQQPPAATPAPTAANPPEQQAALAPPSQALPRAQEPEPAAAAPPPRQSRPGSVSLQAAEIKFADSGLTLTPDDDRRLADVVKLYDKHGGTVRVVGYGRRGYGADAAQQELASFSRAIERANVVAKALTQLGLASNRIVVQAAPIGDGLGEDRAEVLLEF